MGHWGPAELHASALCVPVPVYGRTSVVDPESASIRRICIRTAMSPVLSAANG